MLSSRDRQAPRRRGPARGHDPRRAARLGRPVVRRLAGARRDLPLHGDANDYTGKGLSRRRRSPSCRPRASRTAPRRTSSSATPCSTARRAARAFFRGLAGERFAVRNSGAERRRRGRRRPRLRVHDRRARRRARPDRAQLRRGHERRPGLRARRGRHVPHAASTRRCSTSSSRSTRATRSRSATSSPSTERRTGSPVARRVLDEWDELRPTLRQGLPDRLQARARRARRAGGGRGQPPRADEFAGESADVVGEPHVRTGDGE